MRFPVFFQIIALQLGASAKSHLVAEEGKIGRYAEKFADRLARNSDLVAAARIAGIDFKERSLLGDNIELYRLLRMGEHAKPDGVAWEAYAASLTQIAKKVGDIRMASAADGERAGTDTRIFRI